MDHSQFSGQYGLVAVISGQYCTPLAVLFQYRSLSSLVSRKAFRLYNLSRLALRQPCNHATEPVYSVDGFQVGHPIRHQRRQ